MASEQSIVERIEAAAREATFYRDTGGQMFRMQWCEEGAFCALDEDTGEEYTISYNELVDDVAAITFYNITEMAI